MLYLTIAEYETAITETQEAISLILKTGRSIQLSIAGNTRSYSTESLKELRTHLSFLKTEKNMLDSSSEDTGGFVFGAGW